MPMAAKGVPKLIEECGELQQVLGKRLAYWTTDAHPDGSDLRLRMIAELGDVLAAVQFVARKFNMGPSVAHRANMKLDLFEKWDQDPDNNATSVEHSGGD